jgi:VanZ family protein
MLAAAALIISAPFVSQVRHYLRGAFPNHYILILGAIVGGSVALALVTAMVSIRDRRGPRYAVIAAALIFGGSYSLLTSSSDPHVAAVERFHFVQYGVITFLLYRAWRPLGDAGVLIQPVLAAMLIGTIEEWFQWFIPGRVGVMEDVFLNWVAIACGLLFSIGVDPPSSNLFTLGPRSLRHSGVAAALFVVVFGMFFDSVHLGHRIDDPRIGSFTSIYDVAELHAHAQDRAARWRIDPPIDRTRLAREDQYRTEGIQHVQARNEAWERGDFSAAWRENLILETYYGPVLQRGHEWPPEQREDASHRSAAVPEPEPGTFTSRAYPYEVYTWSPFLFWTSVIALAAGLLYATKS